VTRTTFYFVFVPHAWAVLAFVVAVVWYRSTTDFPSWLTATLGTLFVCAWLSTIGAIIIQLSRRKR
jgi:hypothetical protein